MHLFLMYRDAMSNQFLDRSLGIPPRKLEGSGKRGAVSPADFKAWREAQGLSMRKAAEALGVSFNTAQGYESNGASVQTGLAMAALSIGCEPWTAEAEAELQGLRGVMEAMRKAPRK
jgi:hypothetical protein